MNTKRQIPSRRETESCKLHSVPDSNAHQESGSSCKEENELHLHHTKYACQKYTVDNKFHGLCSLRRLALDPIQVFLSLLEFFPSVRGHVPKHLAHELLLLVEITR